MKKSALNKDKTVKVYDENWNSFENYENYLEKLNNPPIPIINDPDQIISAYEEYLKGRNYLKAQYIYFDIVSFEKTYSTVSNVAVNNLEDASTKARLSKKLNEHVEELLDEWNSLAKPVEFTLEDESINYPDFELLSGDEKDKLAWYGMGEDIIIEGYEFILPYEIYIIAKDDEKNIFDKYLELMVISEEISQLSYKCNRDEEFFKYALKDEEFIKDMRTLEEVFLDAGFQMESILNNLAGKPLGYDKQVYIEKKGNKFEWINRRALKTVILSFLSFAYTPLNNKPIIKDKKWLIELFKIRFPDLKEYPTDTTSLVSIHKAYSNPHVILEDMKRIVGVE